MKKNIILLIICITIIVSFLVYLYNVNNQNKKLNYDFFQKANNDISDSDYYYNYLKSYYTGFISDSLLKNTHNFLDVSCLYSTIKLNNAEKNKYNLFLDNKQIFSNKLNFFKITELTDRQIKNIYERNKFICIIDQILIPFDKDSILNKIYTELKNGADATIIKRTHPEISAQRELLEIGFMPYKIEDVVYKMKSGELKKIKAKNGYYIIRFLNKIKSTHFNDCFNSDLVRKEYINNYINKKSEDWKINNIKNNKAINYNDLTLIDFSARALPKKYLEINRKRRTTEKIIAIFNGHEYTIEDIAYKIHQLPEGIQLFFYNQQTRLQSLKTLLLKENNYVIALPSAEYLEDVRSSILFEKMIRVNLDSAGEQLCADSVQNKAVNALYDKVVGCKDITKYSKFSDILLDESNKLHLKNTLQKGLFKATKSKYYKKLKDIEESKAFPWLYPEFFNVTDSFFIDQKLLFDLPSLNCLGKKNIAYSKNWGLKVDDLINNLRGLTNETLMEIQNQEKLIEFVYFLAENNGIKKQNLLFNNQLLSYMPFILNKIKMLPSPSEDDEIAVAIDSIHFTLGDLKNRWADTNTKPVRYLTEEQITKLIEDLYWLNVGQRVTPNKDFKSLILWKLMNNVNFDFHKYYFSDITLNTIFCLLQERFQKEKSWISLFKNTR